MPLFASKFNPKKGTPRKAQSMSNLNLDVSERQSEFGLEYGPIKMRLGSNEIMFDGSDWIAADGVDGVGTGGGSQREMARLRQQNQQLHEENNLLKIKMDLLLDMLSKRTAEIQLQENEIDQLKKVKKR